MTGVITRVLPDDAASRDLGRALGAMVADGFGTSPPADGFTIHCSGDLGAGKTTVVRALLQSLGVQGRIKSPTYTLVEPYVVEIPHRLASRQRVNIYCYHFDFYRFEDPQEWQDAGFRDYFSDAVLRLVEWPERARSEGGSLLPPPDVHLVLEPIEGREGRRARLSTETVRGTEWLSRSTLGPPPTASMRTDDA